MFPAPAGDCCLHVLEVPLQGHATLGAAAAGGGFRGSSQGLLRPLPSSPRPGDVRMGVASSGSPSGQLPEHTDHGGIPEDLVAAVAAAAIGQGFCPMQAGIGELPFPKLIADLQPAGCEVLVGVLGLHPQQLPEPRGIE